MLKKIKMHMLKTMYNYHYHMTNYYYRKVGILDDRAKKHVCKEFELVNKLVQM